MFSPNKIYSRTNKTSKTFNVNLDLCNSSRAFQRSKLEHRSSSDGQDMKSLATQNKTWRNAKFSDANRMPKNDANADNDANSRFGLNVVQEKKKKKRLSRKTRPTWTGSERSQIFWSREQSLTPHSTKLASTGWKVMSLTRPDIRPLSSEGTGTSNWAPKELSDSQN